MFTIKRFTDTIHLKRRSTELGSRATKLTVTPLMSLNNRWFKTHSEMYHRHDVTGTAQDKTLYKRNTSSSYRIDNLTLCVNNFFFYQIHID